MARLRLKGKTGRFTNDMHPKTLEELRYDLAANLKTIRKAKGLAQERLALDAGVDRTVVSKIERGVTNPSLDVLLRLANHFSNRRRRKSDVAEKRKNRCHLRALLFRQGCGALYVLG